MATRRCFRFRRARFQDAPFSTRPRVSSAAALAGRTSCGPCLPSVPHVPCLCRAVGAPPCAAAPAPPAPLALCSAQVLLPRRPGPTRRPWLGLRHLRLPCLPSSSAGASCCSRLSRGLPVGPRLSMPLREQGACRRARKQCGEGVLPGGPAGGWCCSVSVDQRAEAGRNSLIMLPSILGSGVRRKHAKEVVGARRGAEQQEEPSRLQVGIMRAGMRCSRVLCWRRFSCRCRRAIAADPRAGDRRAHDMRVIQESKHGLTRHEGPCDISQRGMLGEIVCPDIAAGRAIKLAKGSRGSSSGCERSASSMACLET